VSVTFARGFRAAGVAAGLKASGRPDLALLVADGEASAAGGFTTNAFPAAPVTVTREHLTDGRARAVVVNSGQANAGTGPAGLEDARAITAAAAGHLGCGATEVLVCSTGVIGPRVPLPTLVNGLPAAFHRLDEDGGGSFAAAILTTDLGPKQATTTSGTYRVGGCAKGAGMIAPRLAPHGLATLLAFITIDAPVPPGVLTGMVTEAVMPVWNGVVMDGCQSTNDTVLVLASGAAGGDPVRAGSPEGVALEEALRRVSEDLARQVVQGAEGASKVLVVDVQGAPDTDAARRVGLAIAGSSLVKTAVCGGDPNPGRILQAIGDAGVAFDAYRTRAMLDGVAVVLAGVVADPLPDEAAAALAGPEVLLRIDLGTGSGSATVFGCDLSEEYVPINARYRT